MALQDGQTLVWDALNSKWDNKLVSGGQVKSTQTDWATIDGNGKLYSQIFQTDTTEAGGFDIFMDATKSLQFYNNNSSTKTSLFNITENGAFIATPTSDYQIANKKYVDDITQAEGKVKSVQPNWATLDSNGLLASGIFNNTIENDGNFNIYTDVTKSLQFYTTAATGGKSIFNITGNQILVQTPATDFEVANMKYVDDSVNGGVANWSKSPAIQNVNVAGFNINNLKAPTTDLQAATKKYVDDNAGGDPASWSTHPATQNVDMASFALHNVPLLGIESAVDINTNVVIRTQLAGVGWSGFRLYPDKIQYGINIGTDVQWKTWNPDGVAIANGGLFSGEIKKGSSNGWGQLNNLYSNFAGVNYFTDATNKYYNDITSDQTLKDAFSIPRVSTPQKGTGNEIKVWFNAGNDVTIIARRDYGTYIGGSFIGFTQVFSFNVVGSITNLSAPTIAVAKYIGILNIKGGIVELIIYEDTGQVGENNYSLVSWNGANGGINLVKGETTEFFANIQFIIKTPVVHT